MFQFKKYKKSIKRTTYPIIFLFVSTFSLQASLNLEDLEKAKKGLSAPIERPPEVKLHHPNRSALVTQADLDFFKKHAKKVRVGSTVAKTSEGLHKEHAALFADIKKSPPLKRALQKPQTEGNPKALPLSRLSLSQHLAKEIALACGANHRDTYIANNLFHLQTKGHAPLKEEKAYAITTDDLSRVEKSIEKSGDKLSYAQLLQEKNKQISQQVSQSLQAKKETSTLLRDLLETHYKEKRDYLKSYKGPLLTQLILNHYLEDASVSMENFKRLGAGLQGSDNENPLNQWLSHCYDLAQEKALQDHITSLKTINQLQQQDLLIPAAAVPHSDSGTAVINLAKEEMGLLLNAWHGFSPFNYLSSLRQKNNFFLSIEKKIDPGWAYNTTTITTFVSGDTAGYISLDEKGKMSRDFFGSQRISTLLTSTKIEMVKSGLIFQKEEKTSTSSSSAVEPLV